MNDAPAPILIVDDYAPNLVALESLLCPLGHPLVTARSGEEAVHKAAQGDFAVILLDVHMPEIDGIETALRIKRIERARDTPLIFLTAHHKDPVQQQRGFAVGGVDYLIKPIDPAALRAKVCTFAALHKQRERAVRERQQALLTDAPVAIAIWGAGGRVFANEVFRRSFGDHAPPEVCERVAEVLRTRRPEQIQLAQPGADGSTQRFTVALSPSRGDDAVLVMAWDARGPDCDSFLSTLSHELRTPLHAVMGWTQMLRAGLVDPSQTARVLATIERNARQQAQIVDDLLDVSHIVAGRLRLEPARLEIRPLVDATLEVIRPMAAATKVALAVEVAPLPPLSADGARLQQVLWNLLSNAVKFTPAGGQVRLEVRADGDLVRIAVSDTGVGIAPEFLPYVFDRFRQADSTSTRTRGGLGLGLAIVRHLVELHGGRVHAESAGPGCGATFVVELPLRPAEHAPPPAVSEAAPSLHGRRVLVVDDEEDARELASVLFSSMGACVRTAANADEALAILRLFRPDVLVSDLGMPGRSGYDLIRVVRGLAADDGGAIPAVALTAYTGSEERRRVMSSGYQVHIEKPFEPERLVRVVAELAAWTKG
jgi:CheY-like chemotaxis protein